MGAWLQSIHFLDAPGERVREAAERLYAGGGSRFRLGPTKRKWTALLADLSQTGPDDAAALAQSVGGCVFLFMVADDDDFEYRFYRDGALLDRYRARAKSDEDIAPGELALWRGRPEVFADLFKNPAALTRCRKLLDRDDFVFESERLEKFAALLGITHADLAYGDFDADGTDGDGNAFTHIPDDSAAKQARAKDEEGKILRLEELQRTGLLIADESDRAESLHGPNGPGRVLRHPDGTTAIRALPMALELLDAATQQVRRKLQPLWPGWDLVNAEWGVPMSEIDARIAEGLDPMTEAEEQMAWMNPETIRAFEMTSDGARILLGTTIGLRVYRWDQLLASNGGPLEPEQTVRARRQRTLVANGHGYTACNGIVYEPQRGLVLFAGLEGIVEALDMESGKVVTLLDPPGRPAIYTIEHPTPGTLRVLSRELRMKGPRKEPQLHLWDLDRLCAVAGL